MKNFIIGIGGTGAKCLEHLVHCCSAGLGPNNLWAGMVDQDEANGNISRTKILLNKYINLRSSLRNSHRPLTFLNIIGLAALFLGLCPKLEK